MPQPFLKTRLKQVEYDYSSVCDLLLSYLILFKEYYEYNNYSLLIYTKTKINKLSQKLSIPLKYCPKKFL